MTKTATRLGIYLLGTLLPLAILGQLPPGDEIAKNLQVLPKGWTIQRTLAPMRGFTRTLGVRCSHCHVGTGDDLSTYDFVSDENPNKDTAREMMRMLGSIGDHLEKVGTTGAEPVNMWCHTCHRGRPRPLTLAEELTEAYKANGADDALAHLAQLKELFYGRGAYDFEREQTLNQVGYVILRSDDPRGAVKFFRLNAQKYPDSANAHDSLGEAQLATGNLKEAEASYRRALELDPESETAKQGLEKSLSQPKGR